MQESSIEIDKNKAYLQSSIEIDKNKAYPPKFYGLIDFNRDEAEIFRKRCGISVRSE